MERVSNDDIPATKRGEKATFEAMLRDRRALSRFLFKGRGFKTHRGGAATSYDRKILDVDRYVALFSDPAIFPPRELLEYDRGLARTFFMGTAHYRRLDCFLVRKNYAYRREGVRIRCTKPLLSIAMWMR